MSFVSSVAAAIGHLYPLKSGCGRFANNPVFRHLDPPGGPDRIARVPGGRALVPGGDYVGRTMRFVGDLDPKVSWIVDQAISPGDTVLDIGANLGLVSLRMAARAGPEGQVHAFEPQPRLQTYLKKTLAMNPDLPVSLHPVALGAEQTTLNLSVPADNAGAASLLPGSGPAPGTEQIAVPVHRLDDYAEEIGLNRVDFIKIDVEGCEAQVFEGAAALLKRTEPGVIILEENGLDPRTHSSAAIRILRDMGYDIHALPRRLFRVGLCPVTEAPDAHDFVAVAGSASAELRRRLAI